MTKQAIRHFAILVWEQYQRENFWQVLDATLHLLAVDIHTYWKEATTAFKRHMIKPVSTWHREANEALIMVPQQIRGDIVELLSQKCSNQKAKSREMFIKILRNLRFLARQGLALSGNHGDDTESNFCQLFCHQVKISKR